MKTTSYFNIIVNLAYSPPTWATLLTGLFVLVTLTLSMYLLLEHLSAYKNPEVVLHPHWHVWMFKEPKYIYFSLIIYLSYSLFCFPSTSRNKNS